MATEEHEGYDFSKGITPCRVREGWDEAGKKGRFFGTVYIDGRAWAIVKWDGDDDPDMFKAESIEIPADKWIPSNA